MLELKNITITKETNDLRVLVEELNLCIEPGEIKALMGPSGSGKSTLLNFLLGHLEAPFVASGEIMLLGENITHKPPHLRRMGVLFQSGMLFPHLSVFNNIRYAMNDKYSAQEKKKIILELLEQVGLNDISQQMPHTLSGGQYIRVALIRTIAADPKALLLDEPFSRLDLDNREIVRRWLFDYVKQKNIPVLLVTHDEEDVIATENKAIYLHNLA